MNPLFGMSLRHGPEQLNKSFFQQLLRTPFGVMNVSTPAFLESHFEPIEGLRLIASDLMPAQTYAIIADDASEKMKIQLCEQFYGMLSKMKVFGATYVVIDLGFSDESLPLSPEIWIKRERMLRMLWMQAHQLDYTVLLPLRYPILKKGTDVLMCQLIRELMCANVGLLADIRVHDIRRQIEVNKMFENILFDLKAIRLSWDAQDGNTLVPQWFDPWKSWISSANPVSPIIFEPIEHRLEQYLSVSHDIGELADIATDLILK